MFKPLRRAFDVIFRQHLSLRVESKGVRVVLRDKPMVLAQAALPTPAELAARKQQQDFALMLQQLTDLLNELPETRSTLRHLARVEKALASQGLQVLNELPQAMLKRALEQLEGLVVNWSPVGLATLRSRMAVALLTREQAQAKAAAVADTDAFKMTTPMDSDPDKAFQSGLDVNSNFDALTAAYASLGEMAPDGASSRGQPPPPARGKSSA